MIVVALSGTVASGKTTLANALAMRWHGRIVRTRLEIERIAAERGVELESRRSLQDFGDSLDIETSGSWVATAASIEARALPVEENQAPTRLLIIDAVRIREQISALRNQFGRSFVHVHLITTDRQELADRYRSRRAAAGSSFVELDNYDDLAENQTEARIDDLADHADVVLDTLRNTEKDLLVRCEARLGLLPSLTAPLVDVLVGGQYGSEGKGNIAYYLAPEYGYLVRVGGPNAGHKVRHGGQHYTHRSLPSGSLANTDAKLIIGPGAVLSLEVLMNEIRDTGVDPTRIKIDPQVMIISADDVASEIPLTEQIRSTGQGAGAAAARRILGRASPRARLAKDHHELSAFISPTADHMNEAFERGEQVLVEGTQGTGLSLYHGQYPFVTSRDTTVAGTLAETGVGPRRVRRAIMVVRSYPIRVGGESGPIGDGRELSWEEIEERSGVEGTATSELSSVTKKKRRVAEFDWAMLRRSAELNSVTDIALTFADYIDVRNRDAYRYEQLTAETLQFVEEVESVSGAATSLIATNFSERSIIDRRTWRMGRR